MSRGLFAVLLLGALFLAAWPLRAETPDTITYRMERGDTLYKLAREYFKNERMVAAVQKANRIRDPRRIPVGADLQIPRSVLKFTPTPLRVQSFSGPVQILIEGRTLRPTVGAIVPEGSEIQTGGSGFISLMGEGDSRVSLPSNSRIRVNAARRYLINDLIDVDLRVLGGRGEFVAPKLKQDERYRVGTPVAVTAVRGTQFRVGHDPQNGTGGTEVVEGIVAVAAGSKAVTAGEGFGVSAGPAGLGEAVKLLSAPEMVNPGRIQTEETLGFAIVPISGAEGYRTQLARDAGFLEVIAESVDAAPAAQFAEIADGRLFVRARAIAEGGLEGLSDAYSFRRKRIGASAAVETSPLDDAYRFAWLPEGEGPSYQGFQLWRAGNEEALLVDEVGLTERGIMVSDLEPGEYFWRVATFQIDEGDIIKVWGPNQKLTVAP